jgi:RecJ-like exonuclease
MGSCIICGTSVDGHICDLHEEDVLFEFRGDHPNQLTTDRYYRGSVDGFAEFGVFVDIGDRVTGLLHRSELDQRLDSLDWEPGDTVFVKVKNVRDNDNIDLGWSIRQAEREFRGTLVDDPEFDTEKLADEVEDDPEDESGNAREEAAENADSDADAESDVETTSETGTSETDASRVSQTDESERAEQSASVVGQGSAGAAATVESDDESVTSADTEAAAEADDASAGGAVVQERDRPVVTVDSLDDHEGDDVRLEGEIVDVRQTSGPTVFELRDETGTVDCAAFVEAGVRAYPDIVEEDIVRLDGDVRRRRGEIQVETEALVALEDEERQTVEDRMADALDERARPAAVDALAEDPTVDALADDLVDAATAIRRAVITDRPVIVRHSATADGYVAGVALERATLPLVADEHRRADAQYHYFDRRPLEGGVYDMQDATKDVTNMLENRERHDEKFPLFVFVAAGGTRESLDGFELLDVYGAPRVVIDDAVADEVIADSVDTLVSPSLAGTSPTTATTLSANVAAHVNEHVREDLAHLPAVSFWDEAPEAYLDAAAEAGYDEDAVTELRDAVALEAYYQSYEDKRELITDLLFGDDEDDVSGLAGNVAEQFREKLATEVDTATASIDHEDVDGTTVALLDTDAFTHRYDFPPSTILLDELFRQADDETDALVGVADDTLFVRADETVDVHDLAEQIGEAAPEAGVRTRSAREQSIRFLSGERDAVIDATLAVVGEQF